jgi:hypothetical protein
MQLNPTDIIIIVKEHSFDIILAISTNKHTIYDILTVVLAELQSLVFSQDRQPRGCLSKP